MMHIVVTFFIIPLTILAPLLIGVGFRKVGALRNFSVYSLATCVWILLAGGLTAYAFAAKLPYFGLVERLNIGALQLWMFLLSLRLWRTHIKSPRRT